MNSTTDGTPFEKLPIKGASPLTQTDASAPERYRVYKAPGDFVSVEANSAADAMKASGLPRAWRIERDVIKLANVFRMEKPAALAVEKKQEAAPAPQATEAVPAATPPAQPETPLTSDQVDQLMKN